MKRLFHTAMSLILAAVTLQALSTPANAHRLNEYLQATILSVEPGHIDGSIRLVPGVAVASTVIAQIDRNSDGTFSEAEQRESARQILDDLRLGANGHPVSLRLISLHFPSQDEMKEGTGEIELHFAGDVPSDVPLRSITFENRHDPQIAAYLVNCLVPRDESVHIAKQTRNADQSSFDVEFAKETAGSSRASPLATPSLPSMSGFHGAFLLGVRHIAEGTDHLLFLLTLLLPAPLLALGGRWNRCATARHSMYQIMRIVTAFTIGHSLTLTLSAFNVVNLPAGPVEVLIAVSILISAVHAIRPLFPGREAFVAGFFGLIHGLSFASALSDLGVEHWYRFVSIAGFNLGIEAMQFVVVAATLPSLLLLSRTRFYGLLRIGGALFAGIASVSWIAERAFDMPNEIAPFVELVATYAPWIAALLFIVSAAPWLFSGRLPATTQF